MGCAQSSGTPELCVEDEDPQYCLEESGLPSCVAGMGSPRSKTSSFFLASVPGLQFLMRQRSSANIFSSDVEKRYYSIHELYDVAYEDVLGTGASGTVCLGTHRKSKTKYAIKVLNKAKLEESKLNQLLQEIQIMATLDHPNILRLQELFESEDEIHLVLELLQGGELLDRLNSQESSLFPEPVARQICHTILATVRYCHAQGIVHRDLKLENFLFETKSPESDLKLIDFGLSQRFDSHNQILNKACGTPYYVSPEVLDGRYTCKCDVWSVGVITYMLLCGSPPFHGGNDSHILKAIRAGRYRLDISAFKNVSAPAKAFIKACLQRESMRPSSEELMAHSWFDHVFPVPLPQQTQVADPATGGDGNCNEGLSLLNDKQIDSIKTTSSQSVPPLSDETGQGYAIKATTDSEAHAAELVRSLIERMSQFGQRCSLGKLFLEAVARTLTPEQIIRHRLDFNRIDKKRLGVLLLEDLKNAAFSCPVPPIVEDSSVSVMSPPTDTPNSFTNGLLPPLSDTSLENIFQRVDFDGSGAIYFHEFLAATLVDIDELNLHMAFEKISLASEYITREALALMLGTGDLNTVADVEQLIVEAGLDASGPETLIDFQTFCTIVKMENQYPTPGSPTEKGPYDKFRKRFAFDS